jgi:hypothetical protein
LGFTGSRIAAEEIKHQLREFLREELALKLSEEKTLITHARTEAARFLGYEIVTLHNDHQLDGEHRRSINGAIGLKIPEGEVAERCKRDLRNGKPTHRAELRNDTDYSIIAR